MRRLPSRLRRLDDALAGLPLDEPMLLTELDGFATFPRDRFPLDIGSVTFACFGHPFR